MTYAWCFATAKRPVREPQRPRTGSAMPKATDDHTTSPEPTGDRGRWDTQQPETAEPTDKSQWPLGDTELELDGLSTVASLVAHLATSDFPIETEVLNHVADQITARRERLKAFWQ